MGSKRIDPFFYKQPSLAFVDELCKPVHTSKPEWFGRKKLEKGEVFVKEAYIVNEFPDEEGLLETAVDDFTIFLQVYELNGKKYPIKLVQKPTECFEAYHICVTEDCCTVEAEDTEGIRRALIYIEDEMKRREGAILSLGEIRRKPFIRTRITRGFFSPTNRPPKCQDELMDDIDYYPDEYLNRIAHDGSNGLFIYTYFNNLLESDCFKEYGVGSKQRIAKLCRIVAKCKRYGIKVYVFGIEPLALTKDLAAKYPDAVGSIAGNGNSTVCTYSELGAKYCIEATQSLMQQVPDLGGIIDCTFGERPTTCASLRDVCDCPRCRNHSRSEILAHSIDLLKEGIRRAGSKADFISYTYGHRESPMEEIKDYVHRAPSDVVLMEAFEDAGFEEQLGKTRQAIDYWLSYVGPSQMYKGAAEAALEEGKTMFAKLQVCCSHELATVPYIPVPGILFEKFDAMYKYKVQGIMECWYFGNYPSIMSKAAGELAFWDDFSDKQKFLEYLAGTYYGSKAKEAVAAWNHFEKGYKNYPINIMFSYYGPMHDGVVWELALLPKDTTLPRSWMLLDKPDGDRIGECLQRGHTLEEAICLTNNIRKEWMEGLKKLPSNTPKEQRTVAEALQLLFASGNNILKFYELRARLGKGLGDAQNLLQQMETIIDEEINHSREMIALCNADSRLGYHSEAEGYKFFPEKLADRIEKLKAMKQQEFAQVRQNIAEGRMPLPWYQGTEGTAYKLIKSDLEAASFEPISEEAAFRAVYDDEKLYIELKGAPEARYTLHFEYELMWTAPGIKILNGQLALSSNAYSHQSIFGERAKEQLDQYELLLSEPSKSHYIVAVSKEKTGWNEDKPLRAKIVSNNISWVKDDDPVYALGKDDISPGELGWLLKQ